MAASQPVERPERSSRGCPWRCVVWNADAVVTIPLSALFRRGEDWAVFKVAHGSASLQPVRLGERNLRYAVVESGLSRATL